MAGGAGHTCSHEAMERALAETKHLCRRSRLLRTECWYAWIRAVVRSKPGGWGHLAARDRLGASDRAIGRGLASAPAAPPLTEERLRKILVDAAPPLTDERLRKILVDNLEIAERSGNRAVVGLLRGQLKRLETRGR
jgi:hypothetical protein